MQRTSLPSACCSAAPASQHAAAGASRACPAAPPQVDLLAAVFLGVAYSVVAILIFTLQNGYIDLFEVEPV